MIFQRNRELDEEKSKNGTIIKFLHLKLYIIKHTHIIDFCVLFASTLHRPVLYHYSTLVQLN